MAALAPPIPAPAGVDPARLTPGSLARDDGTAGVAAAAEISDGENDLLALARRPTEAAAAAAARNLLAELPAAAFAQRLGEQPGLAEAALPALAETLAAAAQPFADELAAYLAAAARARTRQLGQRGRWSPADLASLLHLMVLDPARFASAPAFRGRMLASLPQMLAPETPATLRDELLTGLNHLPGFGFAESERLAAEWGAAPRTSAGRRLDFAPVGPELRLSSDDDPIVASVYCLPSAYFDAGEAARLLAAVRAVAPARALLVLTDLPLARQLSAPAAKLRVDLLETWGRTYSPWPRDPFSFTRLATGALVVLVRPNVQHSREEDLHLGPALVGALPAGLDRKWGGNESGVRWTEAPVPFHNGQVLLTREAAWISLHTVEPRVLALLGLARVPVESFTTAGGISRYVAGARRAAGELETLYRRPVRFVHTLPEPIVAAAPGSAAPSPPPASAGGALMETIGGGAGFDLDSLVTLLPAPASRRAPLALVASLAAGKRLLAASSAEDLASLRRGYGLAPAPAALRAALAAAQDGPRATGLEGFLDLVAANMAGEGFQVRRLPLLTIPTALLTRDGNDGGSPEFLLGWNNVVVEARRGKPPRAEGFAALLPSGDAEARRVFTRAGCRLDLLPPLAFSIARNGGYRCASNQIREAPH